MHVYHPDQDREHQAPEGSLGPLRKGLPPRVTGVLNSVTLNFLFFYFFELYINRITLCVSFCPDFVAQHYVCEIPPVLRVSVVSFSLWQGALF